MKKQYRIVLVCLAIQWACWSGDAVAVGPTAKAVIAELRAAEDRTQALQMKFVARVPSDSDRLYIDGTWGVDAGREFLSGKMYERGADKSPMVADMQFAFDGEQLRLFRDYGNSRRKTGRIASMEPETFHAYPTPATLLGSALRFYGRQTCGETLERASMVILRSKAEDIDGHSCHVVEATGTDVDQSPGTQRYDAVVWLDPVCDYRARRIEVYYSLEGPQRLKAIVSRVDINELTQVGSTWVPTRGLYSTFNPSLGPPPELSATEFGKLSPKEMLARGKFDAEPLLPPYLIVADRSTVKINAPYESDRFTVAFPQGTLVMDETANGISYTVGGSAPNVGAVSEKAGEGNSGHTFGELATLADANTKRSTWYIWLASIMIVGGLLVVCIAKLRKRS